MNTAERRALYALTTPQRFALMFGVTLFDTPEPNTPMSTPETIPEDLHETERDGYQDYERQCFRVSFHSMSAQVHETAKSKGWWDTDRNNGEALALIHSEVSEALEALRMGNPPDDKIPEFSGAEAELADVVIRIMDLAHARDWNVGGAIVAKMEMNKGRTIRHGGKAF